jgi:hypothetical protein
VPLLSLWNETYLKVKKKEKKMAMQGYFRE